MKKNFCMLLVALLLLAFAPASLAEETATVDMTEPVEIEIMAYFVMDVDPDTDPIMQYLEEKFNVDFTITLTNIDNYADTLNMRVASGDMPDWFRITDQSVYGVLQEDGLLLNVSELVDKYGFENIQAAFDAPNASILATDGVFYRVPDTIGKLCRCIYFRADWLEELGIETPTTYDEMVDALRQIVEADPDGNGTTGLTCYGLFRRGRATTPGDRMPTATSSTGTRTTTTRISSRGSTCSTRRSCWTTSCSSTAMRPAWKS